MDVGSSVTQGAYGMSEGVGPFAVHDTLPSFATHSTVVSSPAVRSAALLQDCVRVTRQSPIGSGAIADEHVTSSGLRSGPTPGSGVTVAVADAPGSSGKHEYKGSFTVSARRPAASTLAARAGSSVGTGGPKPKRRHLNFLRAAPP